MPIHAVSDHLACNQGRYRTFCNGVVEINTYNKFLPSLKDKEGSPEELVWGNIPFTELELCNIILTALPFGFATAFWVAKGTKHFPVCVKTLKENLELIKPNCRVMATLVTQVKGTQKGQSKSGKDKDSKRELNKPIPRKTEAKISGNKQEASKPASNKKQKKNCEKCTKWSPKLKHTHDTSKC